MAWHKSLFFTVLWGTGKPWKAPTESFPFLPSLREVVLMPSAEEANEGKEWVISCLSHTTPQLLFIHPLYIWSGHLLLLSRVWLCLAGRLLGVIAHGPRWHPSSLLGAHKTALLLNARSNVAIKRLRRGQHWVTPERSCQTSPVGNRRSAARSPRPLPPSPRHRPLPPARAGRPRGGGARGAAARPPQGAALAATDTARMLGPALCGRSRPLGSGEGPARWREAARLCRSRAELPFECRWDGAVAGPWRAEVALAAVGSCSAGVCRSSCCARSPKSPQAWAGRVGRARGRPDGGQRVSREARCPGGSGLQHRPCAWGGGRRAFRVAAEPSERQNFS